METKGIVIVGGGGHARVLIDILKEQGQNIIGYTDLNVSPRDIWGIPHIGNDESVLGYLPNEIFLVNAIGSVNMNSLKNRERIFNEFASRGYKFPKIISPHAIVSGSADIKDGAQIMAGATVQCCAEIGENTIINTGAIIEHDCKIGDHVHVASGVVVCGGVLVGDGTHVGAGATIIQGISVGKNSLIAAGSVVIKNVPPNSVVMGVPAR